jgi:regulator of sigma E protease
MGIILAVIIIGIIILIHEFGHYIVGKLSGCSVSRFSIGWGPKIFSFKKRETNYQISWLPFIGGYVRLPGMEGESTQLTQEEQADIEKYDLKTFEDLRTWQKFSIFLGGIIIQIVVCILLLTLVISILGKPVDKVLVADVESSSPAQEAGLQKMDIIIKADGKKIKSARQFVDLTKEKSGGQLELIIKRENQLEEIKVKPKYSQKHERAIIGIKIAQIIDYEKKNMAFSDYTLGGFFYTGRLSKMIIYHIWQLITKQINLKLVMGPVGIVSITKEVVQTGFIHTLLFFALININLAVINLIPFPALDGGHVLLLSIEKIFRIEISAKTKEIITMLGFLLLIALMIYVTFNDIVRLMQSDSSQSKKPQQQIENK